MGIPVRPGQPGDGRLRSNDAGRVCGEPLGERLGILVPRYRDSRLGVAIPPNLVEEGLEAAMTSGSLIPLRLFARVGMFVEELFIDGVDYEFSLRVRAAGLVIAECAEAVLEHSPGEPRVVRFGDDVFTRRLTIRPCAGITRNETRSGLRSGISGNFRFLRQAVSIQR